MKSGGFRKEQQDKRQRGKKRKYQVISEYVPCAVISFQPLVCSAEIYLSVCAKGLARGNKYILSSADWACCPYTRL